MRGRKRPEEEGEWCCSTCLTSSDNRFCEIVQANRPSKRGCEDTDCEGMEGVMEQWEGERERVSERERCSCVNLLERSRIRN